MEYQQIKYFIAAAKYENFSRAAKELYISPQSVAKQIALLENELGIQLFERVGRKVVLNSNGEYVLKKLQKVDQEMEEALSDIHRHLQGINERVRISFFAALPKKQLVTPLISALLSRFPDFQIELKMIAIEETISQLLSGEADIVFTNIEETDVKDGIGRIVFQKKPAMIVVAPGHPWWGRTQVTVEDMKNMDFVKLKSAKRICEAESMSGLYNRIPCKKEIYVPNFDTMYTILEQGKVFAVFPDAFANVDRVDFHFLELPVEGMYFDTAAVYFTNNKNPAVRQVIHFLENEWNMCE